ncbi:MAG: hypothetical protein HYZ21_08680 [Chloroflexi bacterium]|nr:hypothetical protein [Chloroflexota bacterium]
MYQYPLTFTFPAFSVSPQITVKDARGAAILSAAKKLLSSKEEINVTRNNQPAYSIVSRENRITDIPSNWDIKDAGGTTLAVIDDDFLSAIDTSKFIPTSAGSALADMEIHRALNLRSIPMYWINDTAGKHIGLVAPDKNSLMAMQLPCSSSSANCPRCSFALLRPAIMCGSVKRR